MISYFKGKTFFLHPHAQKLPIICQSGKKPEVFSDPQHELYVKILPPSCVCFFLEPKVFFRCNVMSFSSKVYVCYLCLFDQRNAHLEINQVNYLLMLALQSSIIHHHQQIRIPPIGVTNCFRERTWKIRVPTCNYSPTNRSRKKLLGNHLIQKPSALAN